MSNLKVPVRPFLRILANGRRSSDTLKFTLIATPEFNKEFTAADGAFEFENWPREMASRLRDGLAPFAGKAGIRLHVREIIANTIPQIGSGSDWKDVPLKASGGKAFSELKRWDVINTLWQDALAKADSNDWEKLAHDIHESLCGKKHTSDLQAEYPKNNRPVLDRDGAIIASPMDSSKTAEILGVLPIRQSDFAIEEEGIRAARVLAKQYGGPFSVLDEREEPDEKDFDEKFEDLVIATDEERARTKATNERVRNIYQGSTSVSTAEYPKAATIVPQFRDVVTQPLAPGAQALPPNAASATDRDKRRATHRYGSWLQRRPEYTTTQVGGRLLPPTIPDKPKPGIDAGEIDRLRGIYFALQGDPVLARLFCLTFDFEISESLFSKSVIAEKLHLAVAPPSSNRRKALIVTAARRHPQGFWPISAFEAHVALQPDGLTSRILDEQQFVEQTDGIWKLGVRTSVQSDTSNLAEIPRYELASLDLRRSVDGKTTGRDRGESHQTGGFTILDRGRADQIARDLALSGLQVNNVCDPNAVIVLHAEELTVGRRVDVAAAKPDTPVANLNWRSLMYRYVDFDFMDSDNVAEDVLKLLFPEKRPNKGLLEEASFQVAARFMPMTSGSFEAVAEEAIYLWDGTPAGVLTESGSGSKARSSFLPFGRVLDLPAADPEDVKLRPPPLRFGVPYLFRLRSMFLGGGSPSAAGPATRAGTSDVSMVPAAQSGRVRPRRFLRHERIAAPVLMLPKHLAQLRRAQMGYEQPDQAIIRSWNSDASELSSISESDVIKGEYVKGGVRTTPSETMRILVAPEVALDLVVRHGMFDKGNATTIRRGGLTDVSYTPARPSRDQPVEPNRIRPSGFPVAITTRRDTLDTEGAIYRRRVDGAADADQRGIPVFEAGGINATKDGAVGYLPDPAIESYCIRARVRGSDRYLDGQFLVPLYQGSTYPNALPLVITVSKLGRNAKSVRKAHPTHISEIAKPASTVWLTSDGRFLLHKPAHGTRVQRVRIELHPGEDFDLEVACLPSAKTLAGRFSLPETVAMQLQYAASDTLSLERLKGICGDEVSTTCTLGETTQALTGLAGKAVAPQTAVEAVATRLLDAMQNKWPIEEIAAVTTLRVCHAVNKPAVMAKWRADGDVTAYRSIKESDCNKLLEPDFENRQGATALFLTGTVEVDLDLVDSFQIVAETVATDGPQLDARDRGRSMISKRSGRWPVLIQQDGTEAYVSPDDVVGFKVAEDGVVTVPRKTVALLNVGNLPSHGAVGEIVPLAKAEGVCSTPAAFKAEPTQEEKPPGGPVFGKTENRLTSIAIGPLFVAASQGAPVVQHIAMQKGAKDELKRTRRLKIEQPHVFKDTLARHLRLMLISVSRFAPAFETAPTYLEGKEQALYRRQPLRRVDQAVLNRQSVDIWMPSTRRPAAPDLRRPEPSFIIERASAVSKQGATIHSLVRRTLTRLYLGRGWCSSGEGERLGIVLWPPRYDALKGSDTDKDRIKLGDRILNLENFEDADLGDGGAFVTRWGGDPIREDRSPQRGNFIPPEAFADLGRPLQRPHRPLFVPRVLIPIPRAGAPSAADGEAGMPPPANRYAYLPVSLLTFEPCFDLDREEWYVDVDLRPIRASEPFVRFGLVRYQEHAISDDLQASEPVTVSVQLLPERTAEIIEEKLPMSEDRRVSVMVRGLGSTDIKDLHPAASLAGSEKEKREWQENFETLRRPKIKLALFHETEDGDNGLIRTPLIPDGLSLPHPDEESQLELEPVLENATLVWSTKFDLPQARLDDFGFGRIVAYLEEIDRRMPASYRNEPIQPRSMFATKTFVDSGPRFSARLAFLETRRGEIAEAAGHQMEELTK